MPVVERVHEEAVARQAVARQAVARQAVAGQTVAGQPVAGKSIARQPVDLRQTVVGLQRRLRRRAARVIFGCWRAARQRSAPPITSTARSRTILKGCIRTSASFSPECANMYLKHYPCQEYVAFDTEETRGSQRVGRLVVVGYASKCCLRGNVTVGAGHDPWRPQLIPGDIEVPIASRFRTVAPRGAGSWRGARLLRCRPAWPPGLRRSRSFASFASFASRASRAWDPGRVCWGWPLAVPIRWPTTSTCSGIPIATQALIDACRDPARLDCLPLCHAVTGMAYARLEHCELHADNAGYVQVHVRYHREIACE